MTELPPTVFPEVERVEYSPNPLVLVECAVKYADLLRVDSEMPVRFQEAIRGMYPEFETMETDDPSPNVESKSFQFSTPTRDWQVTLERSSLRLATSSYVRWTELLSRVNRVIEAFVREYEVTTFKSAQLHYLNAIHRETMGYTKETPWDTIVRRELLGPLTLEPFRATTRESHSHYYMRLRERDTFLAASCGLARHAIQRDTVAFMIDGEFTRIGPMEASDVAEQLEQLHQYTGPFFRYCITDELHRDLLDASRRAGT